MKAVLHQCRITQSAASSLPRQKSGFAPDSKSSHRRACRLPDMPRIRELWFVHNDCMGLLCWLVVSGTAPPHASPLCARSRCRQSNAVLWYSNYVIVHVVLLPWLGWRLVGAVNFCAFETVVLLAFVSLMRTTFTNPGTAARNTVRCCRLCFVHPGSRPFADEFNHCCMRAHALTQCTAEEYDAFRKEEELHGRHPGRKRLCGCDRARAAQRCCTGPRSLGSRRRCLCEKPYRTHHCSTCKACIIKMDHHCPWVNNCVGASNQKYFVLFLLYVLVGELYAITLLVIRGIGCLREADQARAPHCALQRVRALHCVRALMRWRPVRVL